MGATTFRHLAKGSTAQEAFANAVSEARYERGHGGYTGTIAEKSSFIKIELPEGRTPAGYALELIDKQDERIDDKWGPAGCFDLKNGTFYFFGWASC